MTLKHQLNGSSKDLGRQLHLKQLELNALLDLTKAISNNEPEEKLYKIFYFTILSNLHVKKMALFVNEEGWQYKVGHGVSKSEMTKSDFIDDDILKVKSIAEIGKANGILSEFDLIIPVQHKDKVLAYVFLGNIKKQTDDEYVDISFVQTLSSILIVAIENKRLARKELQQEALKKELSIAREVQAQFIPGELPSTERISVKATYLPHRAIGGDYYDYIEIDPNRFLVCIADVSGKGIPAALLMSNFQASLRTLVRQTSDLVKIFEELNHSIMNNSKGERFITFFAAICDLKENKLNYINAGHNPPVLLLPDGGECVLDKGTTILGAFPTLPFIDQDCIDVPQGSLLVAFTDGITETCDEEGEEEFGFEKLKELALRFRDKNPQELHKSIMSELDVFKGGANYADDISLITCWFH
ncbi:PP2C family protein-serine/threonine phosphatase [Cytophagaceae bacterium ABcell3]|nr:PP2C family protein-serine/threonine phosphatase [Cytophagaceae bacterium ABcell3]